MKIILNDDAEIVKTIREGLRLRNGYCPCRTQDLPEYKCICKEFLEQTTVGPCHCGLYVKVEV